MTKVAAFVHSLIIEAYWELHAGDITLPKRTRRFLYSHGVYGLGEQQTVKQSHKGDVRFRLQWEPHGALRALTFEW